MGNFVGVYSTFTQGPQEGRDAGKQKRYWFVWDSEDAGYSVQALDGAFQPMDEALVVDPVTFRVSFSAEPSILAVPVFAASACRAPAAAVTPEQSAAARTEMEVLLRARFGTLLLKVRRGDDVPGTLKALRDIAEVEEGIVPEHKFMFAEFGIILRKRKLPEIALAHARRVLALSPGDSHAHFNIARIYHILGKLGDAEQHLLTALEFSPDLEDARKFLAYIGKERRKTEFDARRTRHR